MDSLKKKARMSALRILAGKTTDDIESIGALASIKAKSKEAAKPSVRGFKESNTKKLRKYLNKS
jgi:hypothetical protein